MAQALNPSRLHTGIAGLCLAGPTACGKTALALALARQLPLEIISVDSALVYRGMDIGTAKPSAAERAAVPHHLIDILDPSQAYSAARFVADATRLAGEIRARQRLPLLVGGTMLYFKALREGLDAMPTADASVRAQIDRRAADRGWPALHAELALVDPVTAARLAPADAQRIQRALEVWQISGRPLSAWQQRDAQALADGTPKVQAAPQWPLVSLEPRSRTWLHQRIASRLDAMFDQGLLQEVQGLRARSDLHAGLPALRCVGYRQVWQAMDQGLLPCTPDASPAKVPEPVRQAALAATRQLAKRQLTWLRSMADRQVVPCDHEEAAPLALQALRQACSTAPAPAPR